MTPAQAAVLTLLQGAIAANRENNPGRAAKLIWDALEVLQSDREPRLAGEPKDPKEVALDAGANTLHCLGAWDHEWMPMCEGCDLPKDFCACYDLGVLKEMVAA